MDTGQPIRFMSQAAVRGAENFRFYADRILDVRNGLCLPAAQHFNYTHARADRAGRRDHALEHAVHAVDLEDRSGPRGGLHGRAQARRMEPADGRDCWQKSPRRRDCPPGVLNVVHGIRRRRRQSADRASCIKAIGFVGDDHTGRAILAQGAPTMKRVHFELGGKNPVIVFAMPISSARWMRSSS